MAALAIFLLNLAVLITVILFYIMGSGIAIESLGAITFRTIVWLLIFISLKISGRKPSNKHFT